MRCVDCGTALDSHEEWEFRGVGPLCAYDQAYRLVVVAGNEGWLGLLDELEELDAEIASLDDGLNPDYYDYLVER